MRNLFSTAVFLTATVLVYPANAQTVTIRASDCAQLAQHVAASDVVFQPGIDLQGRPVVPADLDGGDQLELPGEFSVPITVDLQRSLGIPVDPNHYQTQNFTVGVVVWKDGRGYFNGQPLQNEQSAAMAALCQKQMDRAGNTNELWHGSSPLR